MLSVSISLKFLGCARVSSVFDASWLWERKLYNLYSHLTLASVDIYTSLFYSLSLYTLLYCTILTC